MLYYSSLYEKDIKFLFVYLKKQNTYIEFIVAVFKYLKLYIQSGKVICESSGLWLTLLEFLRQTLLK